MNPDDLIEKGLIRDTDLEGGPPEGGPAELGPFGRYMLLEELGRGGAGIVFRALDPLLNRELALKRLRFGDFELEARFLREAELLARLSHPGIMPVFDFGRESDALYFTMPLSTGLSLDRWIVERRPDARESARIVHQSAEALAHAHERGVLHRDVKPANILVTAEGNAVVADFGLGRVVDPKGREAGRMTASGEVMGTPSYMAPEFASGDLRGVDARCDVYGLGATLYEAMTGRPPFIGKTTLEILKRVTSDEPVPPRRLAPAAPADLEIICLKALEKDPARRYATSREFADDLGRFLAGEPIHAHRASVFYRIRRFVGRRRAIVSVALAGFLIAAGVGLYYGLREDQAAARRRQVSDFLQKADDHRRALDHLLRENPESHADVVQQASLALGEIDKALKVDPEFADAYYEKGRIHSMMFKKVEARRNYDLAIQKGPVARAYLERAVLDCQDLVVLKVNPAGPRSQRPKDLQESICQDLDAMKKLKPDPGDWMFAEALMDFSQLDVEGFKRAVPKLQDCVAQNRDWRAFYWKGVAELELGRLSEAKASLEAALAVRRRVKASARFLERLGTVFAKQDLLDEAEKNFKLAIDIDDQFAAVKVNLASVLIWIGRKEEALQLSQRAIDLEPPVLFQAHAIRALASVDKHKKLPPESPAREGRALLENAKISLEIARAALRPASDAELEEAWDYVVRKLDF